MIKSIYLIRHGQTEFNKQSMVQGSGFDTPLNLLGRAQARAFYDRYKDVHFDRIYTSTLQRTSQSVSEFLADQIPHTSTSGLNEISWGDKEGRKLTKADDQQHYKMLADWKNGLLNEKAPGGESPLEVWKRQKPVWENILEAQQEKNVLICMHGRAMRMFLCMMLGLDLKGMDQFEHSNLTLYLLEHDYSSGQTHLILRNDLSHLEELSVDSLLPTNFASERTSYRKESGSGGIYLSPNK